MTLCVTPTINSMPQRAADFSNLAEALDYAALGTTGSNFYGSRGQLIDSLTYTDLSKDAKSLARKLLSMEFKQGDRVVIVAETHANFLRSFFACQYAGLIPAPVPVPIQLGSRASYVRKTRDLLISAHANGVLSPASILPMVNEACKDIDMKYVGDIDSLLDQPINDNIALYDAQPEDTAYIQFTSGSTRFPRGVVIQQKAVLSNLARIIKNGIKITQQDRAISWLPFYHDMGLVGLVLSSVASQTSVDYLDTRDFVMRFCRWLEIMSRNKSTITFSPPFGYELVERRLRESKTLDYDLSSWRIAGIGAETIRPEPLLKFARTLEQCGFNETAFLPCYGMAECSLAISFADVDLPLTVTTIDAEELANNNAVVPVTEQSHHRVAKFIDCGPALPDHDIEIRDDSGQPLPDGRLGVIHVKGPSVMSHYFDNTEETENTLQNGWLNTGDIGFLVDGRIHITGRQKDLIIVNGRNIWPQDIEHLAEQQPEIRTGDALAFSAPGFDGETTVVLVMQCRERNEENRVDIVARVEADIKEDIGVNCFIKLVPPHTLPRTSSGKLSRSAARRDYMEQNSINETFLTEPRNTSVSNNS